MIYITSGNAQTQLFLIIDRINKVYTAESNGCSHYKMQSLP